MKKQSIYTQITAGAFLMLYLFVAMPVQLWHHHNDAPQKISALKFFKTTPGNNLQSENCKICQHTYSPYVEAYPVFTIEFIDESSVKRNFFIISCLDVFLFQLSNKSPPEV